MFFIIRELIKNNNKISTIVAQEEVSNKYELYNQIITDIKEIIIEIINTYFKLGDISFAVFAGIIKNAPINNIQNIFILIDINNDKNIKNNKLYKSTFIHFDLAMSWFIIMLKNFSLNIKNNI